jgi:hypothetical protein
MNAERAGRMSTNARFEASHFGRATPAPTDPPMKRRSVFDYAAELATTQEVPTFPKVPAIPSEYSGKWIALSADLQTIVAFSDSFEETHRLADERRPDEICSLMFVN